MANTTSTNSFAPLPGSASRTALMTFTCFVKLPPELRVMIWEVVANQPRNIDIRARGDDPEEDLCTAEVPPLKFWTTQPVPGVLHANQEARQVGLKFYELSFGAQRFPGDVHDHPLAHEHPLATWAFNVYQRSFADSYGTAATTLIHGDVFHDEILLYYDGRLGINLDIFGFTEVTEENIAKLEEGTPTDRKKLLVRLIIEGDHRDLMDNSVA
ncbi:hypothetical protein IFR04_008031 [Cadophora malorum]|uniref:2EXR domain-containing protein n=1 Tax=Cadophora malorum TaxID=108018 RepID=A0A8H7W5X6_9HELO|nr:hypothetical protein IFR04_008031 [Cadophora malorum]